MRNTPNFAGRMHHDPLYYVTCAGCLAMISLETDWDASRVIAWRAGWKQVENRWHCPTCLSDDEDDRLNEIFGKYIKGAD